jgi:hypothetical protein
VKQHSNSISLLGIAIPIFIFATLVRAQEPISSPEKSEASLNVTEIIEQLSHHQTALYSYDVARSENEHVFEWSRDGEFLIDTNIIYAPSIDNQCSASVAFDGVNYLVVWQDDRNGSWDICGTRVSQSGAVIDPIGISIATATNDQSAPSVAFDGNNYLVVWGDWRSNSSSDVYGARVDRSGNVLDTAGIIISTAADNQYSPSITFDGTNYLVVWEDGRNDPQYPDIYGARVDMSGNVLDTAGIAISTTTYQQGCPSVAFDGTNYLVVWHDGRNNPNHLYVCGARVDQSGNVLDTAGIIISTSEKITAYPSIAFDGTNYLVVWDAFYPHQYWTSDIYGTRVDTAGNILDPYGIGICTLGEGQFLPSVAFDGTNYIVVWQDCGTYFPASVCGARVDTSGTVLDPTGFVISTGWPDHDARCPSVAFDSINYLVVWEDTRFMWHDDIYGARVDQAGIVLDPDGIGMSTDVNEQGNPAVGFDGTNYLVVWEDTRNDFSDLYGTRMGQDGNVLDPAGIPITTDSNRQCSPAIAFNGTNYLVVWHGSPISGARVNQSGNVLDTAEIHISSGGPEYSASVASSGLHYLVVWHTGRQPPELRRVRGARVHQGGWVMDPGGFDITTTYTSLYPSVASDGTNYLVGWTCYRGGSFYDVYGSRVNQAGAVLDPAGIAISIAEGSQGGPSTTFDGTNYLLVWSDGRNGSDSDIYGARVTPSGDVLDPDGIPISTAVNDQSYPAVAFDGTDYLVVWQDNRNGSWDIYGARLTTSGTVIDTFSVSLQPGDQISPALAHGAGGQILITYSGWTGEYGSKTFNTMRIWGKYYPSVGAEERKSSQPCATILQINPNPFRHSTTIRYSILDTRYLMQEPTIKIYDAAGRLVKYIDLESSIQNQESVVSWDGTDQSNRQLASGVYFVHLQTGDYSATNKVLLIR